MVLIIDRAKYSFWFIARLPKTIYPLSVNDVYMEAKYVSISIPKTLIDEIDEIVGTRGFTSRTEFIKYVCRRYLEVEGD